MRLETLVTCLCRLRSLRTHITWLREERRLFSSCRYRRSIVSCNCEIGSWFFVIISKVAALERNSPLSDMIVTSSETIPSESPMDSNFGTSARRFFASRFAGEVRPGFQLRKLGQNAFVTIACNESVTSVPRKKSSSSLDNKPLLFSSSLAREILDAKTVWMKARRNLEASRVHLVSRITTETGSGYIQRENSKIGINLCMKNR